MDTLIIFFANQLHIVIAIIAVVYFVRTSLHTKKKLVMLGAFTLPLAYVLAKLIGLVVQTVRPFAQLGVEPLVYHIADNGFPSEHTLYALVIAGVIYCVHKKLGVLLVFLALLVGFGRVVALIHSPVDIAASVLIALVVIYVSRLCIHAFFAQIEEYLIELRQRFSR